MEIQGWLMLQILIWRKFFFPPSFYLISARGSDLPCLTFDLWMSYFAMEILGCWSHVRVFFKLVFFFLSNLNFFFNYFYLWWSSFFPCNSYMFVFLDVNVWIFFFFFYWLDAFGVLMDWLFLYMRILMSQLDDLFYSFWLS